jgi:hypothetical protein
MTSLTIAHALQVNQDCSRLPGGVVEVDSKMRILMMQIGITPPSRRKREAEAVTRRHLLIASHADSETSRKESIAVDNDATFAEVNATVKLKKSPVKLRAKRTAAQNSSSLSLTSETTLLLYQHIASDVSRSMAQQLRWDKEGVLWFAHARYLGDNNLQVFIMLADQSLAAGLASTDVNMTSLVTQAMEAFRRGDLVLSAAGVSVQPLMLNLCDDLACNDIISNVTALAVTSYGNIMTSSVNVVLGLISMTVATFIML